MSIFDLLYLVKGCVVAIACGSFVGCAYKQTRVSQAGMRETLVSLYQDQVMDNLIRTKNHLPIMQLAYSNAVGQVTNTTKLGANGETLHNEHNSVYSSNPLRYFINFAGEQDVADQISVTADPVMKPSLAAAYKTWSEKIKLQVSAKEPAASTQHICLKHGDKYYFIDEKDVDSQEAFVELYNEVSQAEPPKPSKAFDQLLNEEMKSRLNDSVK